MRGPGTGWDLHEYRLLPPHLGEQGASLLMLMAKSRHKTRVLVHPSALRLPHGSVHSYIGYTASPAGWSLIQERPPRSRQVRARVTAT